MTVRPLVPIFTSCSRMVKTVVVANVELVAKDAPIAKPSVKLWAKSAARLRYPATFMGIATALAGSATWPALAGVAALAGLATGAGGAPWEWPCPPLIPRTVWDARRATADS